jgi:hypothetical protein
MKVKVFEVEKNGKISFTKNELEKLLNEVYDSGYEDGKRSNNYWTWTSPYKWEYPYYTTTTATNATLNPPSKLPNTITCGDSVPKIKYEPTYEPYEISITKANINMGEVHNTIGD